MAIKKNQNVFSAALKKAVDDFIAKSTGEFQQRDIIETLPQELKSGSAHRLGDDIEDIIEEDSSVLCLGFNQESFDNIYVVGKNFYREAQFCISPTQEEIEKEIIFPGDRFYPFLNQSLTPLDISLAPEDFDGKIKSRKTVSSLKDLRTYHSMIDHGFFLDFIGINDKKNLENQEPQPDEKYNPSVTMKVFDFSGYFKKFEFEKGDSILLKVKDWEKGFFSFSFLPGDEKQRHFAEIKDWCDRMDDALERVFEDSGHHGNAVEQMEQAFLIDPGLMKTPYVSISEFLRFSQKTELLDFHNVKSLLWRKGANPVEDCNLPESPNISLSAGTIDSLDAILQDCSIALQEHEIEAFMRDELFRDGNSVGNVLKRCLGEREGNIFYDEAQHAAFINFIEEMWEDVSERYDKTRDAKKGNLRFKVLKVFDSQNEFIRMLENERVKPEDLPKENVLEFSRLAELLSQTLRLLNSDGKDVESSLRNFEKGFEATESINESLMKKIKDTLGIMEEKGNE